MRVLVVDDHTLFRQGLRFMLINLCQDVLVVESGSCEEACKFAGEEGTFDLILLDLQLPGISGLRAVAEIRTTFPSARLVVLSGDTSPQSVDASIEAGAMGYVPKTVTSDVLLSALRLILSNGVYLPAEIMRAARVTDRGGASTMGGNFDATQLTERQRAVLKLLVQGAPNKRIARQLEIGEATVKTHVAAVLKALDVHNRTEAVYATAHLGLRLD